MSYKIINIGQLLPVTLSTGANSGEFRGQFTYLFSLFRPASVDEALAPPDKPITINMNIKIEHEISVKVDKALEDALSKDNGLF
jgi:hypothetical protein